MKMIVGFVPGSVQEEYFIESCVGVLGVRATMATGRSRPGAEVKQTQRWLGMWAYDHPATTYPWRREQARRRVAAFADRLARMREVGP